MSDADNAEALRASVVEICRTLPEVTISGDRHLMIQVRGKTFAYHLVDHHGDGRIAVHCKAGTGVQTELVEADPARFFVPAYLGAKGWVGLDLEAPAIDWAEVGDLLEDAYRLVAPKRLVADLDAAR